ncbi:MAG: hypothetical protein J7K31_02420 [Candidatus Aenigmarchaeota archaeon]|nr:hypothetical protein [Candidatus Aenigmarchaeota archaeon]
MGRKAMIDIPYRMLLGIILLAFILYIIYVVILGYNYQVQKRLAIASAQDIADAMNFACMTGKDVDVKVNMPEKVPDRSFLKQYFSSVQDPQFILYYEAFPEGEDLAWSNYIGISMVLALVPIKIPGADKVGGIVAKKVLGKSLSEAAESVGKKAGKKLASKLPELAASRVKAAFPNIIKSSGHLGTWVGKTFIYQKSLSAADRAMDKFSVCSPQSLCLKTKDEKIVFPLDECKKRGIMYVELSKGASIHDTFDWGTVKDFFSVGVDKSFYLASPCKARFRIYHATCKCSDVKEEPVYFYDEKNDTLRWIANRTVCEKSTLGRLKGSEEIPCLKVKIYKEDITNETGDNFCYTSPQGAKYIADALIVLAEIGADIVTAGSATIVTRTASNVGMSWLETRWAWPRHPFD